MRKCYLVIGTHTEKFGYCNWVSGVFSSMKKASECCKLLKSARQENDYNIQVEVIQ